MYSVPEVYFARNCLHKIDANSLSHVEQFCSFLETPCDGDMCDLLCIVMEEEAMILSDDIYDRVNDYIKVRNVIYNLL